MGSNLEVRDTDLRRCATDREALRKLEQERRS